MNQERKEELIVKWMDEALSPTEKEEFASLLEAEPELRDLKEGHGSMKAQLQEAFPADADVPYGDFFTSRLQRAIAEESAPALPKKESSVWSQFLRWGAAPAMAAALVVAFLAGTQIKQPEMAAPQFTFHPEIYTPSAGVSASYASLDQSSSVILLDGLEEIPESLDLIAMSAGSDGKAMASLALSGRF